MLSIRWMIRRDWPNVTAIVEKTGGDTQEDICQKYSQRRTIVGMVAEHKDRMHGFFFYQLYPRYIEVLQLRVLPQQQRRGVGKACIAKLVTKLHAHKRNGILVHVHERNLGAQLFLRSCAFKATKVKHNYYEDSNDAAYVFEYNVHSSPIVENVNTWSDSEND